jgi:hypothetical protein
MRACRTAICRLARRGEAVLAAPPRRAQNGRGIALASRGRLGADRPARLRPTSPSAISPRPPAGDATAARAKRFARAFQGKISGAACGGTSRTKRKKSKQADAHNRRVVTERLLRTRLSDQQGRRGTITAYLISAEWYDDMEGQRTLREAGSTGSRRRSRCVWRSLTIGRSMPTPSMAMRTALPT